MTHLTTISTCFTLNDAYGRLEVDERPHSGQEREASVASRARRVAGFGADRAATG